jgi:hypothetical protein
MFRVEQRLRLDDEHRPWFSRLVLRGFRLASQICAAPNIRIPPRWRRIQHHFMLSSRTRKYRQALRTQPGGGFSIHAANRRQNVLGPGDLGLLA